MAALVQSFPQQSGTVTMLQTRPASAGGILPPSQGQSSASYAAQQQRHSFYGGGAMGGGYRTASAPIQPYAFTSTPSLNTASIRQQHPYQQQQQYHQLNQQQQHMSSAGLRSSTTAPSLPRMQSFDGATSLSRTARHQASASMVNLSSSSSSSSSSSRYMTGSRDDSTLPGHQGVRRVSASPRPQSAYMIGPAPQLSFNQPTISRASPERYRRSVPRSASAFDVSQKQASFGQASAIPSGSGMAGVGHLYDFDQQSQQRVISRSQSHQQLNSSYSSSDDMQALRQQAHDDAGRKKRRSLSGFNGSDPSNGMAPRVHLSPADNALRPEQVPLPGSPGKENQKAFLGSKEGSSESLVSTKSSGSRPSSTNRNGNTSAGSSANPALAANPSSNDKGTSGTCDKNKDSLQLVNIPPRSSSSDAASRLGSNSSPLSRSASSMDAAENNVVTDGVKTTDAPSRPPPVGAVKSAPSHLESPAMRHLSAINQKGRVRSKASKLRRAFTFGTTADVRKTTVTASGEVVTPNKLQKEPSSEELYDAEQARIAQQQEEAGIGNSIYANAKIFSGSTDNLSISSTASSASIMIRKMGRGMKKGTRSLVGLFRPKSIIGMPDDDSSFRPDTATSTSASAAIEATVSMVTVEAERERVNVNADVHAQNGGGTGFPRLERNSIDASRASIASDRVGSSGTENSAPRKNIVGGDKERAEVLAAVRRGILKNTSNTSLSSLGGANLSNPPPISESPASSAPSTPNDEAQGHKRTGSVALSGEDYFVSALRLRQESSNKSGSSTPQGSMRRSATFSPRIVFHDTWPSQEYDRRSEICTCNRLTPMLAQQIKEELNSFKMEMEVHENSKIYTHFF